VGVVGADAQGSGQLRPGQLVPQREVQHLALARVEPGGGVADERLDLLGVHRPDEVDGVVLHVAGLFQRCRPVAAPQEPDALVPRDGVQPGAQPLGVAELVRAVGGDQQRVVDGVRRRVAVAEHPGAVVVEPHRVPVVGGSEPFRLPVAERLDDRPVLHGGQVNSVSPGCAAILSTSRHRHGAAIR
jgi:hypothetical protein